MENHLGASNDETSTYEVFNYKPFKAGLPNLTSYFKTMWKRRELAAELARSELRAQQSTTVFGQFWLVLNPLFLALIYYTLVVIISGGESKGPDFLAHLLAGLFAYHFVQQSMTGGSQSVTGVGRLITNRSFPRLLLPIAAVIVAFRRFLPTLIVYVIFHLGTQQPISLKQLASIPAFALLIIFCVGLSALLATVQVYFRDTKSFLPYIARIWLYISPVLYYPEAIPSTFAKVMQINPLYSLLTCWSDALVKAEIAPLNTWIAASFWAFSTLFLGVYIFLSREREFAVRI
jgi:teichoic acid transport system permease protein